MLMLKKKEIQNLPIQKPYIPKGFEYVEGDVNTGFVIQDLYANHFIWVPVKNLTPNGTLDGGLSFNSQFGRRDFYKHKRKDWQKHPFNPSLYYEKVDEKKLRSLEKYGGFYVSQYTISKNEDNKPCSQKGNLPWIWISAIEAQQVAQSMCMLYGWEGVHADLPYGAEWDSILQWLVDSGCKTLKQVLEDSWKWGNYSKFAWYKTHVPDLVPTGSLEKCSANRIYDLAGNTWEWTREQNNEYEKPPMIVRGGAFNHEGHKAPAAFRSYEHANCQLGNISFRVTLTIE